jgi:hypothetical protein
MPTLEYVMERGNRVYDDIAFRTIIPAMQRIFYFLFVFTMSNKLYILVF